MRRRGKKLTPEKKRELLADRSEAELLRKRMGVRVEIHPTHDRSGR